METKVKNREWVKNAAIIFLAVLLVLTFFSNTIMNRSLPEIATAYVNSGSITAKVRGSGTVESLGSYEVKATETREIRAVMVKSGQNVEAGDVLFVLGEGDSAEIEAAQDQLRQLKLNYSQTAAGATNYGAKLAAAQSRYENAVAAESLALSQMNNNPDFVAARDALDAARSDYSAADLNLQLAQSAALNSLDSLIFYLTQLSTDERMTGAPSECAAALNNVLYSLSGARSAAAAEDGSPNSVQTAYDKLYEAENGLNVFMLSGAAFLQENPGLLADFESAGPYFDNAFSYLADDGRNDDLMDSVIAQLESLERSNSAQALYDGFNELFSEDYNEAVAERKAAEATLKALEESAADYNQQAAITGLSLQDLKGQIERAQQKLDSLSGGAGNQIISNVSGTVSSVAVTAGTTAAKDQVIAVIDVPDMGYALSFSVTNDQAKRLHIGDGASVTSYYWGSRIEATLTGIKPDPKNPQTNRLLEFEVKGDVSPGSQLTISIGERGQNYDFVVPNSAIRSDSNGKFVLAVQAKNSALGNRYFARRVDVEVLATDDNNSAVTGALNYGDFVITTSSAPIKSGDQVRMAEG